MIESLFVLVTGEWSGLEGTESITDDLEEISVKHAGLARRIVARAILEIDGCKGNDRMGYR